MGLLLPGSANDQGWNTMAYNALKQVEKDLGAEVSYVELKQDPASYEKAFRDFAAQGYQLVMGHGNEFEDAAKAAAVDYPNVQFFISSSRLSEPTVTGLNTASDQPLYLMGVIAAKMCKAAGFVGGMEIPPISEALTGFINGAKSVDPNFKVYSTYIGNFEDAAAAKEAALGMIAQGADCIVPDADAAGQGVYQAVVEKKDQGIKTFGVFVPATDAAPGQVLANYVSNYGQGVTNLAKQVKEGTYKGGKNVAFGFDMPDVIMLNYDETATTTVPDDVRAAVEAAKKQIAEGKIDTLAAESAAPAPAAGCVQDGVVAARECERPGLEHDGVQCAEAGREGPGRRGFVRRAEAGPGVVREGVPRLCGAGLPARHGPRQRVRGCGEGGGRGLPERPVLHLLQPAERADRHRPEHGVRPAALPDGRDRGQDVQGGGLRGRHGDPAHLGGADRLHQRRQERGPELQGLQHVHRQL